MNGLYIVFTTLVFGFIIFNFISNKKISIFSIISFIILCIFYAIKRYDGMYYHDIIIGIPHIHLYAAIGALVFFIISILEYVYGCKKYKKSLHKKLKDIKKNETIDLKDENVISKTPNPAENIDNLLVLLEMMNEPLACLFGDLYFLNNKMKKLLEVNSYKLPKDEITNYINYEDKKGYKLENKVNYFRLTKGLEDSWYEEISASLKGNTYRLIRLSRNNQIDQIKLKPFKQVHELLKGYKANNINYYLVLFDIKNSTDFSDFYGSDFRSIVINKYLKNIKKLPYLKHVNLYKISITEYALILDDKLEYQQMLIELANNNSLLLHQEIYVNETKVKVQSKVAIVDSSLIETKSIKDCLKAGYNTLSLVCNKAYNGDYAIYNKIDDNIDYSLNDMNIDLNIDLDKYNKMMK